MLGRLLHTVTETAAFVHWRAVGYIGWFDQARSIFHERVQSYPTESKNVNTQERQPIPGSDPLPNRADDNGWNNRQSDANSNDAPLMIQKEQDHDEADVEARQSRHTKDELKDLSQQAAGQTTQGRPRSAIMVPPINVGNIVRMDLDIIFFLI